jgi:hypothetical protein
MPAPVRRRFLRYALSCVILFTGVAHLAWCADMPKPQDPTIAPAPAAAAESKPAEPSDASARSNPALPPAFRYRTGAGRSEVLRLYRVHPRTELAILAGLRWLKAVQDPDGSWDARKWGGGSCGSNGATAMALLAFLGNGCTDKEPPEFAATVRKATECLIAHQRNDGGFGERMYEQGLCATALAEASGMMGRPPIKQAAQKALNYILKLQPPDGGFSYTGPGNDTCVTGFQMQALKAGLSVGLDVPVQAKERVEAFLMRCLNKDGSSSYQAPALPEDRRGSSSMTASALTARLLLGHPRDAADCRAQAKFLTQGNQHIPIARAGVCHYTIYYMSLAFFNLGGKYWDDWGKVCYDALRERQVKEGPMKGSWPPEGADYGAHGGRIYTTVFSCLALETCFRYVPVGTPDKPAKPDEARKLNAPGPP